MNKDSNFTGQLVYSQVLKLLDKEKNLQISRKTKGSEAYVKRIDGYQHLVVMLFGILKHFDSLRELEIGMKAEAHKLRHLGMDYLVSRPPKSYKGQPHEPKDWEKLLYMMDSTTITLFDNILKGIGQHPKSGKKKGGMKAHTVMKYHVGVPMVVQLTSSAKHDHYLLKEVHLPKDSTLTMDRGYIDIAQFQQLTDEGVCYVTKMKKNLNYKVIKSVTYVNPKGLVTHIDQKVEFNRSELTHEARRVEIFPEKKKPVVLLTNNFDFPVEDISEIYRLRWAQATQAEFPPPFLLWRQCQRHTNTDLGGIDCQFAHHRTLKKHQKELCILSGCHYGASYAYVLHRFYRIYGKSGQNLDDILAKEIQKAPPEPSLFD